MTQLACGLKSLPYVGFRVQLPTKIIVVHIKQNIFFNTQQITFLGWPNNFRYSKSSNLFRLSILVCMSCSSWVSGAHGGSGKLAIQSSCWTVVRGRGLGTDSCGGARSRGGEADRLATWPRGPRLVTAQGRLNRRSSSSSTSSTSGHQTTPQQVCSKFCAIQSEARISG